MKNKVKKYKNILSTVCLFIIIILLSIWTIKLNSRTDFNEYTTLTKNDNEDLITISNDNKKITKEFYSAYPIIRGISIDNIKINGKYTLEIKDLTNNKKIIKTKFNSKNVDNQKVILNFKQTKINKKHKLSLKITKDDNTNEEISFYSSKNINLYGGESRGFWFVFPITTSLIILSFCLYGYYLSIKNKNPLKNKLFQSFLVGFSIFSLLYSFRNCNIFLDETDYILSGIRLANGVNLYSGYLTQHMPFQSFISAIIHKVFQAYSFNQFRLCWYIIMGISYAFIYYRYSKIFGKTKMFFIPILHVLVSFALPGHFFWFVADMQQMLALLVLLLEFLCYFKDGELKTSRVIIISACIFISFTSIFASAYNIFIIFIGFIIKEIQIQKKEKRNFKALLKRYSKLLLVILPFIIFLLYLILTKSLDSFIEQAYIFNREIYPKYAVEMTTKNYGKNIFVPFFSSIFNIFATIPKAFVEIFSLTREYFAILILLLTFIYYNIKKIKTEKKHRTLTIITFIYIALLFQRTGISFHTLPAYLLIVTIIIINTKFDYKKNPIITISVTLTILIAITLYGYNLISVLSQKEQEQSILVEDKILIDNSESGDHIFFDLTSSYSLYPSYKNRVIINKNLFTYPWFMEVYQEDQIEELKTKKPKYVVYNYMQAKDGVQGYKDYDLDFRKYINENYTQIENSMVYKIKNQKISSDY